jgi:hypothetical protein
LLNGTENCAGYVPPAYVVEPGPFMEDPIEVASTPKSEPVKPSKPKPEKKQGGLLKNLSSKFDSMTRNLFDDSEDKS